MGVKVWPVLAETKRFSAGLLRRDSNRIEVGRWSLDDEMQHTR